MIEVLAAVGVVCGAAGVYGFVLDRRYRKRQRHIEKVEATARAIGLLPDEAPVRYSGTRPGSMSGRMLAHVAEDRERFERLSVPLTERGAKALADRFAEATGNRPLVTDGRGRGIPEYVQGGVVSGGTGRV